MFFTQKYAQKRLRENLHEALFFNGREGGIRTHGGSSPHLISSQAPSTTTHSQMNDAELAASGIGRGTIRLSIGIEHIDDLLAALTAAFAAV